MSSPQSTKLLTVSLVLVLILVSGCNRSESTPPTRDSESVVSSLPPFKTKEPERYRAKRITTSEEYRSGSSQTASRTTTTFIFRSGVNRREEYESENEKLIYLENVNGRFIIAPALKSYADLSGDGSVNRLPTDEIAGTNVTEGLLIDAPVSALYQPIGAEEVNGRRTVKYLVRQTPNETNAAGHNSFVWVDDDLGLPIRSESTHTEAGTTIRFVTELQEISTQVDEKLFEIPSGFQKVEVRQLSQRNAEPQQ